MGEATLLHSLGLCGGEGGLNPVLWTASSVLKHFWGSYHETRAPGTPVWILGNGCYDRSVFPALGHWFTL